YLFYLISVRPPGSTLFPYTTLFRSRRGDGLRRQDRRGHAATCARRPQGDRSLSRRRRAGSHRRDGERLVSAPSATPLLAIRGVQDRKSTRLNSSHRTISYAVFCLKK